MIAIKLAAAGLLMLGGTAELRAWQEQPAGATAQQGETDSVDGDQGARLDDHPWLVGRWCDRGRLWVTIVDGEELIQPDGTRHPYRLALTDGRYVTVVFQMPAPDGNGWGYEGVANYDMTLGEPSFSAPGNVFLPLRRC